MELNTLSKTSAVGSLTDPLTKDRIINALGRMQYSCCRKRLSAWRGKINLFKICRAAETVRSQAKELRPSEEVGPAPNKQEYGEQKLAQRVQRQLPKETTQKGHRGRKQYYKNCGVLGA